ncbi:unnamed protein product [Linum trigynum]|uniref:Uncharacterized protein n=1 Tax=Linum trigynum TaxID=586398 RepID=A0AAV2EBC7_9ROSI
MCLSALKVPEVKKSLGVPEITIPPAATTAAQTPFNLFSTHRQDEVVEEAAFMSSDDSSSAKTSSNIGSSSSIMIQDQSFRPTDEQTVNG